MGKKVFLAFSGCILVGSFYIGVYKDFNFVFDQIWETGSWMYTPPYARAHPYYVGIAAAYFLQKLDGQLVLSKIQSKIVWVIFTILAIMALNATIVRQMRPLFGTFLISFERFAIGFLSSWIIIASLTGHQSTLLNS